MKFNSDKTGLITVTGKTNVIKYSYKLCDECITRTDSIKKPKSTFGVLFSPSRKMFELTRTLTYFFLLLFV
jgi:hypothetical protein